MHDLDDDTIREFYALYVVHRDALDGTLSDVNRALMPSTVDDMSERNLAALALTFQVGEALAELNEDSDTKILAQAVFWLLRAYESGHRQGWEPGPSTKETMDGVFTWLCRHGFDPGDTDTPHFVPQILVALAERDHD